MSNGQTPNSNQSRGPLRVLVIPASYFAQDRTVGGGERYALEYARALACLTPTTLGLFDLSAVRQREGSLEVRTFAVRHFRQRWGFAATARTCRAWRDFDVLHIMVFPTPLADLLLLLGRWRRQTIVLTDVGGGGACWSTRLQQLHPRLNLNRLAHGLAFLSRHAATFFPDWPHPRTILYGGADLGMFSPETAGPQGYALLVGRLLPHKGALPLIEAVGPRTPLRIVGRPYDESYFAQLKAAAQGKDVTFITDADDAELLRQYRSASVVLQPSLPSGAPGADKSELLGLVTIEAMACGKPVIVTRTCSLPELVEDGVTGFVVPPLDRAALGARVTQLTEQPELSLSMGRAARQHVENHFTWARVASRGLEFYRSLREPGPDPGAIEAKAM